MKTSFIEVLIKLVFGFDVMDSCLKLLFSLRNAFKKIGIQLILIEARVGAGAYIGGGGVLAIGCVLGFFRYKGGVY